jgi:hypothetical protein
MHHPKEERRRHLGYSARGCGIQIASLSELQKLKLFFRFREKLKVTGYWL